MSFIGLLCESSILLIRSLHFVMKRANGSSENGAKCNGPPGVREEMSRQPYYAAFAIDVDGNNIEAVCAPREVRKR